MYIRIQALHFNVTTQLESFTQRKVEKIDQYFDGIISAEVILKVVKPETVSNKLVEIRLEVPNGEFFASKQCDTFEEAVDLTVEALKRQVTKYKEKVRGI